MPLRERDRQMLDHVHRHRLTTREFLQQQFFPESSLNAVGKVTSRLAATDWLREHELQHGFRYLVLGQRGRREIGADSRSCWRFTEQSFPLVYGLAAYCLRRNLRKPTTLEFQAEFPELFRSNGETGHYFLDTSSGTLRLGKPLLDRGSPPKLILKRLDRLIMEYYRAPGFLKLIQENLFSITILTAWPTKQRYLFGAVRKKIRGPVHVDVQTVPELQRFFPRV